MEVRVIFPLTTMIRFPPLMYHPDVGEFWNERTGSRREPLPDA